MSTIPGAFSLRTSPDGRRIALSVDQGSSRDVWIYDVERDTRTRLTSEGNRSNPIWTPDGRDVAYVSALPESNEIQSVRADGTGEVARLYSTVSGLPLGSFSPDGKHLVFAMQAAGSGGDLWIMPVERLADGSLKGGPPEPFLKTSFNERDPEFSPDGRWIAYVSDDTGRSEVYVRPFPGPGGRRELFYLESDHVMVARYRTDREFFTAEKPRIWKEHFLNPSAYRRFDTAPDGKRLLQLKPLTSADERAPTEVTFLLNFFDELRRRVPMEK